MLTKQKVKDEIRRLGNDYRIAFLSCVRYCLFDMHTEMQVDAANVSGEELHRFTQEATLQLLNNRSTSPLLTDLMLDLVQGSPWGLFAAVQERQNKPVLSVYMPPRSQFLTDEIQIGEWPGDVTIKGDFLISLYDMTEKKGHRLDAGVTETGK